MITALSLLAVSVLAGAALGLVFRVWVVAILSPAVAVISALCLNAAGFGIAAGVVVGTGCLVACQAAYLLSSYVWLRDIRSVDHEVDGEPGDGRQNHVRQQHGQRDARPARPPMTQPTDVDAD